MTKARRATKKAGENTAAKCLMLRTRQQKRAACENQSLTEVIDIDTYQFKASPVKRRVWITNGLYSLTQIEREILTSPVGWLSDPIIDASQLLLKQQSMLPGFQVASVGMTQAFDIQQQGFIQILHNGFGHWLTISTIGATSPSEVFVYDSLYYSIGTYVI